MKIKLPVCFIATAAMLLICSKANAQAYLSFSKYIGGSGAETTGRTKMKVVNGETYLLGGTTSPDFPVTNGSTYKGGGDLIVAKYAANGDVLYATYLGGSSDDYSNQLLFDVVNGEAYIATSTSSADYPVTIGTGFGGIRDVAVTKLGVNGNIVFSTLLGGVDADDIGGFFSGSGLVISGNEVFVAGNTASFNFPRFLVSNTFGGVTDAFVSKLNATTGAIIQSRLIGGSGRDFLESLAVENGFAYVTMISGSQNSPVTIVPSYTVSDQGEAYVMKLNAANFNVSYSRFVGPNIVSWGYYMRSQVINGEVHLYGGTNSADFTTTNGTVATLSNFSNNFIDGFYTRLNTDGSIGFSTILAGEGNDFAYRLKYVNGTVYLAGNAYDYDNGTVDINVYKINASGSFGYSKLLRTGRANGSSFFGPQVNLEVVANDVYLSGVVYYPEYPVTNNSQFYGNLNNGQYSGSGYFTHLNSNGDIVYSSFLGKMRLQSSLKYANNKFYLLGESDEQTYPVTDSSTVKGGIDNILIVLKPDGSNQYSTYIGGDSADYNLDMEVFNNDVYFYGVTNSLTYPVTQNTLYKGNFDRFLTKVSFCPDNYLLSNDTLRPAVQSVCKNGLGQKIIGQSITVPGDSLPLTYRNGITEKQKSIGTSYQWQVATSLSGPFANIPNAIFKDYTPTLGTLTQYYRRLAYKLPQCGGTLVHISDTVSAVVNNNLTAPSLNLNGPYITCPGSPIIIGGSPTASGGNPPYTLYEWDNNLPAVANPTANPFLNTIYTLLVTDNSGCKQIGQALVNVYSANAGLNKSNCAGTAVRIGGAPINAVTGIVYNWQPATDLSSTTVAQPYANPPAATNYILTLTVPKTGGSTCATKDTMTVTPAAPPVTADFAGPDRVTCFGEATFLGTAPEAGFKYIWSPGFYLSRNDTAQTTFYPGNILMPYPNPATINLTAQKAGCFFTDQVEVAYIESRPGIDGCGPRLVGLPDRTPNINETYSWTLVSGPGNFLGANNQPVVPVSASVGGTSVYGLTVSYRGGSCYKEVNVSAECNGCRIIFYVTAQYECPSYNVNFGDVSIQAVSGVQNPIYTWQPQVGLSNYNSATVRLTDNVQRTYFVTVTSADDSTIRCTDSIKVNDPAFSRPIFNPRDTVTCVNQPVTIGATNVAGYTYTWDATIPGLSSYSISNPVATVAFNTTFPVTVNDGNGCQGEDTVTVRVENVNAAAGSDWLICSNGLVKLGSPAQPGTTYLWEPQLSPWQNGTNQFSAQPELVVAADITFYVTATTPAGCIVQDSVDVVINNSPTLPDAPDTTVCKGTSVTIGLPALPGVTYQWFPSTGLNDASLAQPTLFATTDITYIVQATFPGNCTLPATDQVAITVSDPSFNMPDIIFCPANGAVQLGNAAPAGMAQYSWQPYYLVNNPTIVNPVIIPSTLTPTSLVLSVVSPLGCSASDSITLTPAILPANAGLDVSLCKNNSGQIGNTGNQTGPAITYSWSPATGLSNAASSSPIFTGTTVGTFTYYLTKTSSNPVCTSIDSVVIKVEELVLPVLSAPSVCRNSCVQIGTAPVAGVQYSWSPATGLSNANIANPIACVDSTSRTYNLTANSSSGCTATASLLVTVSSVPAAQISIPAVTACVGDTGIHFNPVINPAAGPYLFEWSPNDGSLNSINLPNPTVFITGAGTKQYGLQVTDTISGCSSSAIGNLLVNNCTATANIGDYMWFDTDGDGLQNNGEIGVSNMAIRLYNSSGFNVAIVVTDANGYYSFAGVAPGNGYYIIFDKPVGYSFTTQNVGGVLALDNSKADNIGRSISFNIPSGASILNIDAGIKASGTTPVTLLSFTGNLQSNKTVLLNWQTTAEYNNNYFDVERSTDGINFYPIGRVNGNGTTAMPHNYSLIDAHPLNGNNYYRLKQVDFDGHFVYSNIVLIRISNSPVVTAFYNNQSNSINIVFNAQQKNTQIKLFAANGQLVKAASVNNTNNYLLELPVLAGGVYMLQMLTDKNIYTEKIFIGR